MKRTRTQVDPLVKDLIEEEARADRTATAVDIAGKVERRLRQARIEHPVPKLRAIQVIVKAAREIPGITPNDPWSLGVRMPQIPPDATGDLLALWKASLKLGQIFTVRQAMWAVRLRAALRQTTGEELLHWATLYSRRDIEAEQQGRPLASTRDLDAELAFQEWKSPLNRWEYDQGVQSGAIPGTLVQGHVATHSYVQFPAWPSLFDYLLEEARGFLKHESEDIDQRPWWPYAESVMVFWLRRLASQVERWQRLQYFAGGPEDWNDEEFATWEAWKDMGKRLAALVVAKAKELEVVDEPGGYEWQSWRPSEILDEIGYDG